MLELFYDVAAAERVNAMVRNEQACCSFSAFSMREETGQLRLTVTAPEGAREAADTLFEQFVAQVPKDTATGCCGSQSACGA